MNNFELVADDTENFLSLFFNYEEKSDKEEQINYSQCPNCFIHMKVKNNQYMCERCGFLKEDVEVSDFTSITSDGNYNALSNGCRCIGANAYRYQSILRANSNSSESNYENLLNAVLFGHSKITKEIDIPKEVRLAVADHYRHIRTSGNVARGTIFKAMLAALTYYEGLIQKTSYKPSDIYKWFEIDPSTYSKGDKKIRELLDYGHLDLDIRAINTEQSYVHKYASTLDISDKHIDFLTELLEFVIEHKIINPNAKSSTRALSIVSFYLTATKNSMTSKLFEEHFKCNFGSVRTLALDIIQKFDMIKPIFEKYEISYDGINTQAKRVTKRKVKKGSRIAIAK